MTSEQLHSAIRRRFQYSALNASVLRRPNKIKENESMKESPPSLFAFYAIVLNPHNPAAMSCESYEIVLVRAKVRSTRPSSYGGAVALF